MEITQSKRLANVSYDIRGPVLAEASRMEAAGEQVLKLNIGNPAPFGFETPPEVLEPVVAQLPTAHGYGDSRGLLSAREAVVEYYLSRGITGVDVGDVMLGNGASELIVNSLLALLNPRAEVLVPTPDYPLWTAAVRLSGGRAMHYRCDESAQWQPDIDDIAAKLSPRTKAIVIINPNNPTGAVYDQRTLTDILELARRHQLVVFSDEIYDKILYDETVHFCTAALAPDVLCLTFNGLSKAYRVAGYRTGWMVVCGPKQHARSYLQGLDVLSTMRLCPTMPPQHAVAPALRGPQTIRALTAPGGRLREQRDVAWRLLNDIPGVSCTKPKGALYAFPRLDPAVYPIVDDERFALDLLRAEHLLVVHGTGFNWPDPDHFRVVTLANTDMLTDAMGRLARFLPTYTQRRRRPVPRRASPAPSPQAA